MRRSFRSCAIALCLLACASAESFGAVPATERAALIAIYNSLGGAGWKVRTNWLGAAGSECTWSGITCDTAESTVVQLDVSWNSAHGTLPKEIGDLPNLEVFQGNGSAISGSIPPEIGRLTKLKRLNLDGFYDNLDLGGNEISGPIPREIGQLVNLQYLNLEGNQIAGPLPAELGQLSNLEELELTYNPPLGGSIPPSLLRLPKLKNLWLGGNKLSGAVPPLSLPALEILDLSGNDLTGPIPVSLAQSPKLTTLDLSSNWFSGTIPVEITQLTELTDLRLGRNPIEGTIPALGNLKKLTVLSVSVSSLTGPVPASIGQLQSLEAFDIGGTSIGGDLPQDFFTLSKLKRIYASGSNIGGKLSSFAKLTNLETLSLNWTNVTGPFPVELTQLSALKELQLNGLALGTSIPPEIRNLTKLTDLELRETQITSVPRELGDVTSLEALDLSGNQLTSLPPLQKLENLKYAILSENQLGASVAAGTFSGLLNLIYLDLGANQLKGTVPAELLNLPLLDSLILRENSFSALPPLGTATKLRLLDLLNNQITRFPDDLANLKNLEYLNLSGNRLAGSPSAGAFSGLTKLNYLDLSSNQLDGSLPAELFLPSLEQLYLQDNRLSGAFPPVGPGSKLRNLDLGANRISQFPSDLTALNALEILRLYANELTGTIPPAIGGMTNLTELSLADNHLSGGIPDLTKLTALRSLYLNGNQLSGPIPDWIGNMTSLSRLYLAYNKLSGRIPSSIANLTNIPPGYTLWLEENALLTDDSTVASFLTARDPDWAIRQTTAPSGLNVLAQRERSITMGWNPIPFAGGPGGYVISYATTPSGPFSALTTTPDKFTSRFIVEGLAPSTNYWFTISTVSYPSGSQQNVVASGTVAAVATSTTAGQPAPASVVVLIYPHEIRQRPGATSTTAYYLQNLGDLPSNITLTQKEDFFTQQPSSFTLNGGETKEIIVTARALAAGAYNGTALIAGDGVAAGLGVRIDILVTDPPAADVAAKPSVNRIDVAAPRTDAASGTVQFTNTGAATLQGLVTSNVAWIIPPSGLVVIPAGESRTVTFTVDVSKRPDASSPEGAVTGTLSLVYESGAAGKRGSPLDGPGVSVTTPVTVVYTITPPTQTTSVPGLGAGEVAIFVSGVGFVQGSNNRTFISDISIVNAFGVDSPKDIAMYYTPIDPAQGSKMSTVSALAPTQSINYGNIVSSVFGNANQGTLQIRTRSADQLFVNANIFNVSDSRGTYGTALPIFRSDHSLAPGDSVFLTGLRRDEARTTYTNMFVQETSGNAASYQVEFFDAAGNPAGEKRTGAVSAFRLASLNDAAPAGAIAARVTNSGQNGRIVAFATPVDSVSGDFWAIADWNHELGAPLNEPVIIPVAGSVQGNGAFFRTDVALTNRSDSSASATLIYYDRSGPIREREIKVGPRESMVLNDIIGSSFPDLGSALGYIEFKPRVGAFSLSSRTFATVPGLAGTYGTSVPSLPRASALRLGQSKIIAGLDVASLQTINAKKPGTFRTNLGVVEIAGASATVEVTATYSDIKQVVSGVRLTTFTYELLPHQSIIDGLVQRIQQSNPNVSDLRNVQVKFRIVKGDGAVVVYASSTDNGTADQVLRTE